MDFIADFETTSVRVYLPGVDHKLDKEKSKAFVCAWALIPQELEPDPAHIIHGRTVESFLSYLDNLYQQIKKEDKKKKKLNVYTHNLKFDGDFILYYILKTGTATVTNEVRENVLYNFSIRFTSGSEVTFYDSMKIFPMSCEKLGKLYGIEKLKGDWDYNKYRDETTEISPEEWGYIDHDVMIVSKALADYRSRGYMENTQAAIAYNVRLKMTYPRFNKLWAKRLKNKDEQKFREAFPWDIMPLTFDLHRHLLLGYFGGISWVNPKYANKDLIDAVGYDVHSMYPHQMSCPPLPVGQPLVINNPDQEEALRILATYKCVVADIEDLTICLKSPRHFPFLMFPTDWETSVRMQGKIISCKNEFAVLSNYDFKIMQNEYNIYSMKITKLYCFRTRKAHYKAFIDYWMNQKIEADKIRKDPNSSPEDKQNAEVARSIAKVMMNSSYGKDGTKLIRQNNQTRYNTDLDVLENVLNAEIAKPEYYLPSAIFICALARWQLYSAAVLVRDDFIYSDTDSIKVTKEGDEILRNDSRFDIDPFRLGAWGYEGNYDTCRFVRQKTYTYTQDGERHYIVCGAPDSVKLGMDIDDFHPGMVITLDELHQKGLQGRLLPVRVPGGVILEETGFQINYVDNWDEHSGKNMPIKYDLFCDTIAAKNAEYRRL